LLYGLLEVASDAVERRHKFSDHPYLCEFKPIIQFAVPLSLREMRKDSELQEAWGLIRRNFQSDFGKPPQVPAEVLKILRERVPQIDHAALLEHSIARSAIEARPDFQIGKTYNRRKDLHDHFGGQQQGGISTPTEQPFIFLFTGESGDEFGYQDGWDEDGVFLYTGEGQEGQEGDMEFVRGNKAIRDHAKSGKSLKLFESLGKGSGYRHVGEFVCATFEYRRGLDRNGAERQTILFHLLPIGGFIEFEGSQSLNPSEDSLPSLRRRAYAAGQAATEATTSEAKRIVYERSQHVKRYVLHRSRGKCEACGRNAPFRRKDGSSYLEPHHTRRRSDGGPDDPRWVAAVCPNCHREVHSGENGPKKNEDLQARLFELEDKG